MVWWLTGWCADAAEDCTSPNEERAHDWTNGTGQGIRRDCARQQKPYGRAACRRPKLGSDDPFPPESDPRDEHRGEESAEDSARPETAFAEGVTDHRSQRAAKTTERAGNNE
jgi:hypothetical protein